MNRVLLGFLGFLLALQLPVLFPLLLRLSVAVISELKKAPKM